ncbi:unnamed protein product [Rotaria sp. Silwood1]|nr:unnamed protein product [Rotaria sp. Silwood1]
MCANIEYILGNFKATYPNDSFYVCKYKAPVRSSSANINDNEVKEKILSIINDTIKITNYETRCDRICDSLKMIFPKHHVNVFIYGNDWQCAHHSKGKASFKKDYGSDVFIILS